MSVYLSRSAGETEAHGEAWGRRAPAGAVFGLIGDLGAGKTAWVRGFARGAGYEGRVRSPTYGLVNVYPAARFALWHLDLYRLEGAAAFEGAGLDAPILQPEGVTIVEWWDRWEADSAAARPPGLVRLRFRSVDADTREITYDDPGF